MRLSSPSTLLDKVFDVHAARKLGTFTNTFDVVENAFQAGFGRGRRKDGCQFPTPGDANLFAFPGTVDEFREFLLTRQQPHTVRMRGLHLILLEGKCRLILEKGKGSLAR